MIGQTKISYAPENWSHHPKSDGRKFDTQKELLGKTPRKGKTSKKGKTSRSDHTTNWKNPCCKGTKQALRDSDSYEPDTSDQDKTLDNIVHPPSDTEDVEPQESDMETHTNSDSDRDSLVPDNSKPVYALRIRWDNNSCWLDASLQALYASVVHDPSFWLRVSGIANDPSLYHLFKYVDTQQMIESASGDCDPEFSMQLLAKQRDDMREFIYNSKMHGRGALAAKYAFQPLLVSLSIA